MDYEALRFWLDELHIVIAAGIGVYGWLVRRIHVLSGRIRDLGASTDERMDSQDQRLTRVESDIEHGPTRSDFSRIHNRIDEVAASISRIEGESHAAARNIDLIHQHLLERKS